MNSLNIKMTSKGLKYPILAFGNDKSVIMFENVDQFTTCGERSIKKGGYFDNLRVVDASGNCYLVVSCKKIKNVGLFWGYDIFLAKTIKAEFDLVQDTTPISLEDFKKKVKAHIRVDADFYESSGFTINELIDQISKTSSYKEIMRVIGK
jgi:hypothetical protein